MNPWIQKVMEMHITELSLSERVKSTMRTQGFSTLEQVMNMPLKELVLTSWFTKELAGELSEYLFRVRNEHTS